MEPELLIIDLFCGAGGVTTGFEKVPGCKVIIGINHDQKAIESHAANHPETIHFIEDIRHVNMRKLSKIVNEHRRLYPFAKVVLHASMECIEFSKAKGGKPKNPDSRSLAEHMPRYIKAINPDFFSIENVTEFAKWGPLDENNKPIKSECGVFYNQWVEEIKELGYHYKSANLKASDYGAFTIRERLFGVFYKKQHEFNFPKPTHTKYPEKNPSLKKWKAVRNVLDLDKKGKSIFNRKKPLSENTLERIYVGLVKFARNEHFIQKYYSGCPNENTKSIDGPAGALTTIDHHSIVSADFLLKYNSTNGKTGIHIPPSVDDPSPTIATQNRLGVVSAEFIASYYGNGDNVSKLDSPSPTIPTKDRHSLINVDFISSSFSNGDNNKSIDQPAPSITTVPKENIVDVEFILNPQWGIGGSRSVDDPCFTLIARMDKAPPYFVSIENGIFSVKIEPLDSPYTVKIKQFMQENGIIDIKMRMFFIYEMLAIQGFPKDYKLEGTQTQQKKFVGNSVETTVMSAIAKEILKSAKGSLPLVQSSLNF